MAVAKLIVMYPMPKDNGSVLTLSGPLKSHSGRSYATCRPNPNRRRNMLAKKLALYVCLMLPLLGVGIPYSQASEKDRGLTVMTRNLDNGTDFGPIFAAQTPTELVIAVSATYAEIQASNIPERAAAIAKEIAAAQPDLVGLQEVFTYRIGPFGGPATTVTYDALQSLLDELERRGVHYAPLAILPNLDAEAPAFDPSSGFFDVRATDHDVVLARTDLATSQLNVSNIRAQHFTTEASITNPVLGTLEILHGWISVDAKKRGKQFRFVTTHLESLSAEIRDAQAAELVLGPANTTLPLVFAGDFNSDAQSSDPVQNGAYRILLGAGLADAWSATHFGDPGFTWPLHGEDPFTPFATPYQRIDLVFARGRIHPVMVDLIGNQLTDLTPSGLWPSDHAGLVASFVVEP
jgi:endonuclease/exonuclease/phosphatase family metal-dependent hydrolase